MILGVGLQDYSYSNMNVKKEDDNKKVDSVDPIFKELKDGRKAENLKMKKTKEDEQDDSSLQIVVKPDGSRVLIITQKVGDVETNMSIKISEPTYMPNDSAYLNADVDDKSSDSVHSGADTSNMLSGSAHSGADTSNVLSGSAHSGADTSDMLSGSAHSGADTSDMLSGSAHSGADTSNMLSDLSQMNEDEIA